MNNLTEIWKARILILDIAFQPIVNMYTSRLYGVEALLRNVKEAGFNTIFEVFDAAYADNVLYSFDLALRKKALEKFTQIPSYQSIKLFYNLDNRLFEMSNFSSGNTEELLDALGLSKDNLCFEISERHEFVKDENLERLITHYREGGYGVAIDDFGVGYSGYKLLYQFTPDVIKIDRFFLMNIEHDMKKKLMLKSITQLAIQLDILVLAEGVETEAELLTCKEIGCHVVQGYFVQRPTVHTGEIQIVYKDLKKLFKKEMKNYKSTIEPFVKKLPALHNDTSDEEILDFFRVHGEQEVLPLVYKDKEMAGVIEERGVRKYLYSALGSYKKLVKNYPIIDINVAIDFIVELYAQNHLGLGFIVTKEGKYYGFLDTLSMIQAMNEQSLIEARDQNPLSKLPGNKKVDDYIMKAISKKKSYVLCYFDLDHFKAFNDHYGFKKGDEVLKLFTKILKKKLSKNCFIGHIGGDDFFVGSECFMPEVFRDVLEGIIKSFKKRVLKFYSKEDKEKGYILGKNREGIRTKFELLSVSIVVLELQKRSQYRSSQLIHNLFVQQKKVAKSNPSHISWVAIL